MMTPIDGQRLCGQPSTCIEMIEIDEMYRRDPDVHDVDDDHIWRITYLLRGIVRICATSEVIIIVLVLCFPIPPTGDYIEVITHVNPIKNQCKPWGRLHKENYKINIIFIFPKGRSS